MMRAAHLVIMDRELINLGADTLISQSTGLKPSAKRTKPFGLI